MILVFNYYNDHYFLDYHQIKIFFAKIVFDIYSFLILILGVIINNRSHNILENYFNLKISFNRKINLKLFI